MSMAVKQHFILINQGFGFFYERTAETLAERGHAVTVLTGDKHRFNHPGIRVVMGPEYRSKSLRSRAWSWLTFLGFVARELPPIRKGAVVLSSSNPPMLPHLCVLLLGKRARHVARVLDIYPEALAFHATTARLPLITPLWHWANRQVYQRCTRVVTLGRIMAETLARNTGGRQPVVIPDWHTLDGARIPSRSENPLRRELGIGDRLVVLYSGNLGLSHDLSVMIEAAELLRGDERVRFVIIGDGPQRERLQATVRERKLEGMFLFLPFQPVERLPVSLGLGDLSVVTLAAGAESVIMPCKTYNYLAAGSAVLAVVRRPSDLAAVVEDHACGFVAEPGDGAGFAAAIRPFLGQTEKLTDLRVRALKAADEYFSPRVCCTHLVELLEQVAAEGCED
jgi:glycosyltransferase involved in cell wall biosynthesis